MRYESIELHNFMSYRYAKLEIKPGLWFVIADNKQSGCSSSNGAGKSSLVVDAPLWIPYGKTVRELSFGATALEWKKDDVVHRVAKKNCMGKLVFSLEEQQYEITRCRKHTSHGNHVFLRNLTTGEQLTGESDAETDEKIIDLLGMDYIAACNSTVFGQGPVKRFSQCSDAERRKVFESFFDLSVFNVARKYAKEDYDTLSTQLNELRQEKASLEARQDTLAEVVVERKAEMDTYDIKDKVEGYDIEIKARETEIVQLTVDLTDAQAEKEDLGKEYKTLLAKIKKKDELVATLQEAITDYQADTRKMDLLDQKIHEQEQIASRFKTVGTCPTCLRVIAKKDIVDLKKKAQAEITKLKKEQQRVTAKVSISLNKKLKLEADVRVMDNLEAQLRRVENQGYEKKTEILRIESNIANRKETIRLAKENKKNVKARHKELETAYHQAQDKVAACQDQVVILDEQIEEVEGRFDSASVWVDGFGNYGVKADCYRDGLGFLNERLDYFLSWLTGSEMMAKFDDASFDKIKLLIDIKNAADKYTKLSSGQAKRIDLCIALAFQSIVELGVQKSNLSIFDEFDAALDSVGRDILVEFLNQEAERKGTCIVISHHNSIIDEVDNAQVIRVVYEGDESRLIF